MKKGCLSQTAFILSCVIRVLERFVERNNFFLQRDKDAAEVRIEVMSQFLSDELESFIVRHRIFVLAAACQGIENICQSHYPSLERDALSS